MNQVTAAVRSRLLPIALSQFVGLLCGIVGIRLSTHLVAPDDFGRYGLFLTFTPLGVLVFHAGLLKFTARHWAAANDQATLWRQILRAAARKLPWLALAVLAASVVLDGGHWWITLPFLFLSATALSLGNFTQTALQADRRHWTDLAIATGGSTTRSLTPPLLYWLLGGTTLELYGGFTLHAVIFAALGLFCLRPRKRAAVTSLAATELPPAYAGTMFTWLAIAAWTLIGCNRWIVALHFGVTTTGYFTLANNVAMIIPMVLGACFTQYFQPDFFAAPHDTISARKTLARRVDLVAITFGGVALAGVILLDFAMPLLTGTLIAAQYADAAPFVLAVGCFFVAVVTSQFYHQLLLAARRESACGPVDLTFAACLIAGSAVSAAFGIEILCRWLLVTPIVPWLVSRPLARRALFRR